MVGLNFAVAFLRDDGRMVPEVPLDQMLRAFDNGDLRAITIRAYERRQGLWTPDEFANDEMVACLKTGKR